MGKGVEIRGVIFTKFSQEKGRKDLEGMARCPYLCPPAEKRKAASSLQGSSSQNGFLVVVKVFRIRKKVLVGMKKVVHLHSQSKNGLQKISS